LIMVLQHQLDMGSGALLLLANQFRQQLASAILGKVIDNHKLAFERNICTEHAINGRLNRGFFVINGKDNGEPAQRLAPIDSELSRRNDFHPCW
jgi:hypothetical protein